VASDPDVKELFDREAQEKFGRDYADLLDYQKAGVYADAWDDQGAERWRTPEVDRRTGKIVVENYGHASQAVSTSG
jgi:hypothetical protein